MRQELLIGAGHRPKKILALEGHKEWEGLITLDINPDCKPDVVWDLEKFPLPFEDNLFDEIHAIEVLEHTGTQGDFKFFFKQFSEFWRILKPNGFMFGTCPSYKSMWAWGDPGHKRIFTTGTFVFLSQDEYNKQIGITPMSDYRFWYKDDFDLKHCVDNNETIEFALQAIKPSRWKL